MDFFNDVGNAFKTAGNAINDNVINNLQSGGKTLINIDLNQAKALRQIQSELQTAGNATLTGLKTAGNATLSGLETAGQTTLAGLKKAGETLGGALSGNKQQEQQQEGTYSQPSADYSGLIILAVVGVVVWRIWR